MTKFIIDANTHGMRIDVALKTLMPEYSRSLIAQWIKQGAITLNLKNCAVKDKVKASDTIEVSETLTHTSNEMDNIQGQDIPLDIIFEDEDILVINKPAGLIVHPGAGNPDNTLANALMHYLPAQNQIPRIGIVHRLDKDTTGLMIIAKSLSAHTKLVSDMQLRHIKRQYLALVLGQVYANGSIKTHYGRHPKNRLKMTVLKAGRVAVTHYRIEKTYEDFTLLRIDLETGRTHQIRVHMAHLNHPVVGDPLYGRACLQFPDFKRQALHAHQLEFNHPITQKPLTFTAPIPDDFANLINILDTHHDDDPC